MSDVVTPIRSHETFGEYQMRLLAQVHRDVVAECSEALRCDHPDDERAIVVYPAAGFLGVPTGERAVCLGCGHDFGPVAF